MLCPSALMIYASSLRLSLRVLHRAAYSYYNRLQPYGSTGARFEWMIWLSFNLDREAVHGFGLVAVDILVRRDNRNRSRGLCLLCIGGNLFDHAAKMTNSQDDSEQGIGEAVGQADT